MVKEKDRKRLKTFLKKLTSSNKNENKNNKPNSSEISDELKYLLYDSSLSLTEVYKSVYNNNNKVIRKVINELCKKLEKPYWLIFRNNPKPPEEVIHLIEYLVGELKYNKFISNDYISALVNPEIIKTVLINNFKFIKTRKINEFKESVLFASYFLDHYDLAYPISINDVINSITDSELAGLIERRNGLKCEYIFNTNGSILINILFRLLNYRFGNYRFGIAAAQYIIKEIFKRQPDDAKRILKLCIIELSEEELDLRSVFLPLYRVAEKLNIELNSTCTNIDNLFNSEEGQSVILALNLEEYV